MAQNNKLRKLFTKNVIDVAQALVSVSAPGKVIANADIFAGTEVGEGNILRIQTTADTFIAFGEQALTSAPTVTSPIAVKLVGAGVHYVICQCDFVRSSIAVARAELLEI
jgi:hypothetical protein